LSNLLNLFLLKRQRSSYNNSLDTLPLWNWWQLQDTGNYKYLGNGKLDDYTTASYSIYEKVFNEFIELGGLGKEYEELLKMKQKWLILRSDYLLNEDKDKKMKSIFLEIDIKEKEQQLSAVSGVSKEEALIIIAENIHTHIDAKVITVKEFYTYINYYKKKR